MASRQRLNLPTFDPTSQFVVIKGFKFDGHKFVRDEPFDPKLASIRKLRQLRNARRIMQVPETGTGGRPSALSAFNASSASAQVNYEDALERLRARMRGDDPDEIDTTPKPYARGEFPVPHRSLERVAATAAPPAYPTDDVPAYPAPDDDPRGMNPEPEVAVKPAAAGSAVVKGEAKRKSRTRTGSKKGKRR